MAAYATHLSMQTDGPRYAYSTDVEGSRHVQVRYRIRGRLDAETYLRFIAGRARWLDIRGWARRVDEEIELLAAGPEALVGALEMACTLGPLDALIESIESSLDNSDPGPNFALR